MRTDASRSHVVVIEHSPEIRLLFEELLAEAGCCATVLPALPESGPCLAERRPDVILHDFTPLTAEDDARAIRRLRTDPDTAAIPLVLCSAAPNIDEIAACLGVDTRRVVRKPFSIDKLMESVERALGATA